MTICPIRIDPALIEPHMFRHVYIFAIAPIYILYIFTYCQINITNIIFGCKMRVSKDPWHLSHGEHCGIPSNFIYGRKCLIYLCKSLYAGLIHKQGLVQHRICTEADSERCVIPAVHAQTSYPEQIRTASYCLNVSKLLFQMCLLQYCS